MGSSDRKPYLSETVLNQFLLDRCQDSLSNGLHLIVHIETPDGYIYASDRNMYVGSRFYEALNKFPVIERTVGDWLSPEIEFSTLELSLSNVDGRFNKYVPSGASYAGWIGKKVTVMLGLRDVLSSYNTIYEGEVTEVGGFKRDIEKITLISRDRFGATNKSMPTAAFTQGSFPDIEDNFVGVIVPYILGDWTTAINTAGASIPAYPVNGKNAGVLDGSVELELVVSVNDNTYLDDTKVYLKRGEVYYAFDVGDVTVNSGKNMLTILQGAGGGTTQIDGEDYLYTSGDAFFVLVKGKALGGYDDNIVWQARQILLDYGGLTTGDFHSNWATFRDKASPSESALSTIKSRVWVAEPQETVKYVLQMLEQVRLEAFVNQNQEFKLNSMHLDDFPLPADISFKVRNWDLSKGSFKPMADDQNVFNRAKADYNFDPNKGENLYSTEIYRNQASITQVGKEISKIIVYPNLYIRADVINQLKETLKIASAYPEYIEATLSTRSVLRDIGNFALIDVKIGSSVFSEVPAMVRKIGHDPAGMSVPVKFLSFQMLPYPNYSPSYAGIVGGSTAIITQE